MNNLKPSTQIILKELVASHPDKNEFRKGTIEKLAKSLGYTGKDYRDLISADRRIRRGTFDLAELVAPLRNIETPIETTIAKMAPQSIVNREKTYAKVDSTFVPWGPYSDV